jgi:hypothetical protein
LGSSEEACQELIVTWFENSEPVIVHEFDGHIFHLYWPNASHHLPSKLDLLLIIV